MLPNDKYPQFPFDSNAKDVIQRYTSQEIFTSNLAAASKISPIIAWSQSDTSFSARI